METKKKGVVRVSCDLLLSFFFSLKWKVDLLFEPSMKLPHLIFHKWKNVGIDINVGESFV